MAAKKDDLPSLVAQTGPLNGQRWMLTGDTLIGRGEDCTIIIPDRQVSRYHVRLTQHPDGMHLEDMGSKNGTHHNGKPLAEQVVLSDGDMIQVALAQQFVYLSSDATLPLESAPGPAQVLAAASLERRLRLDKRAHRIWVLDRELTPPLSVSQFRLLELLYDRQGLMISRAEVISQVWGDDDAVGVSEQALDALIRRLRDRLASMDPKHSYILTIRGHGLRLDNPGINE